MARWEPDARGRLEKAALELFHERGYGHTTVEEIAARAGLTERTFFRYYADKREVLFFGAAALQKFIAETIANAPATAGPLQAMAAAIEAVAPLMPASRERARLRRNLIAAHAELKEREQLKLTSLGATAAEALRARGVAEPAASLTAEAGIAVFKVGFESWMQDSGPSDLGQHIRVAFDALKSVIAGAETPPAAPTPPSDSPARPRRTAGKAADRAATSPGRAARSSKGRRGST